MIEYRHWHTGRKSVISRREAYHQRYSLWRGFDGIRTFGSLYCTSFEHIFPLACFQPNQENTTGDGFDVVFRPAGRHNVSTHSQIITLHIPSHIQLFGSCTPNLMYSRIQKQYQAEWSMAPTINIFWQVHTECYVYVRRWHSVCHHRARPSVVLQSLILSEVSACEITIMIWR
jgi:hypothetical protein